jgi:hypothetical protein
VVQQLEWQAQQLQAEKQEAVSKYQRALQQHSVAVQQQQRQQQRQHELAVQAADSNSCSSATIDQLQSKVDIYVAREAKHKEQYKELRERYRQRKADVAARDGQVEALELALMQQVDKANGPGGAAQLQEQVKVRTQT